VGVLDESEDRVRVLEQNLTGVGERHGAAALRPVDEPVADSPLEDRDLLTDRRLGEAEPGSRRAKRAFACDRPQRGEVPKFDTGPGAEGCDRGPIPFLCPAGQPPFCFPPARVCPIRDEPAIIGG